MRPTRIREIYMSYENMRISDVQRLAKQGDKEALYEMVWRHEELIPGADPIEQCAWQDYWYEKAANAGHIDAKFRYAQSLISRVMNAEDRQKAMIYFQNISDDYDAGKLITEDDKECGIISKLRLGIMLCEGYYTKRDAVKGVELINAAENLTNGFSGYGFVTMSKLGELYATGLAQPGEEPSIADLEKAIKYLGIAIDPSTKKPDNLDHRKLELVKQLFETQKKRVVTKREIKVQTGKEDTFFAGADERRKKMMEISDAARQRMEADKAALKRLQERLAREGW